MHSPLEIAVKFIEIGIHKARMSALKILTLGIFAGIYIGFAGIASTTAGATIANPSVSRLVSACVFPAGMAMVLVAGSELFTGNNLIIIPLLEKKITLAAMLKNWTVVFLGNFLGAFLVAAGVVYAGVPELYEGVLAQKMVAAACFRVNQSWGEAFVRGILCNILVCIAVWAAFAAKKVSGKLLMSFWPVMLFVLCGFEHSIADIYFGISGILVMQKYGIVAPELTLGTFFLHNLIPVTIGNVIGGAGIVGCGYWFVYLHHTPGYAQPIEQEQREIDGAEEY